jgi:putative hemolysin
MKTKTTSKLSIILNIVLLLFFIIYFCVPFSATGFWSKAFSPLCTIISAFQGPDFLPGWCLLKQGVGNNHNDNNNNNNNVNNNLNTNANTNVNVGLANPAAVKCQTDGGASEAYATTGGEAALCVFFDKSICEEWAYFRGECKKGECQKVCKAINTKSEGWYNSCTGDLIKAEVCSSATNDNANLNTNANANINAPATNTNANLANPKPTASSSIMVNSPVADQQLASPIVVSGRAKTPDNKIYVRVKSKSGTTAISVNGTVKNIGADGYGDFKLTINYEFSTTKEGSIDVYGKDGETEVGLVNIPVKF